LKTPKILSKFFSCQNTWD